MLVACIYTLRDVMHETSHIADTFLKHLIAGTSNKHIATGDMIRPTKIVKFSLDVPKQFKLK